MQASVGSTNKQCQLSDSGGICHSIELHQELHSGLKNFLGWNNAFLCHCGSLVLFWSVRKAHRTALLVPWGTHQLREGKRAFSRQCWALTAAWVTKLSQGEPRAASVYGRHSSYSFSGSTSLQMVSYCPLGMF